MATRFPRFSRDGVTGENWEGDGVTPDVQVEAELAQDRALALISREGESE